MIRDECLGCIGLKFCNGSGYCDHHPQKSAAVLIVVCPLGKFYPAGALPPPAQIDPDYIPTPTNATEGGCGCKK